MKTFLIVIGFWAGLLLGWLLFGHSPLPYSTAQQQTVAARRVLEASRSRTHTNDARLDSISNRLLCAKHKYDSLILKHSARYDKMKALVLKQDSASLSCIKDSSKVLTARNIIATCDTLIGQYRTRDSVLNITICLRDSAVTLCQKENHILDSLLQCEMNRNDQLSQTLAISQNRPLKNRIQKKIIAGCVLFSSAILASRIILNSH